MSSFYLRTTDQAKARLAVERFPRCTPVGPSNADFLSFSGWGVADHAKLAYELADFSASAGCEVFLLDWNSVVDSFCFHRCVAGQVLRSLVYGCDFAEREWESVIGAPEPWERDLIFTARQLQHALADATSNAQRADLERRWRDCELVVGSSVPYGPSARDVATYYGFPDYAK